MSIDNNNYNDNDQDLLHIPKKIKLTNVDSSLESLAKSKTEQSVMIMNTWKNENAQNKPNNYYYYYGKFFGAGVAFQGQPDFAARFS